MPPASSTLVEEGREFWRRYPDEYQKGFSGYAVLSELHRRMLKQRYFPVIGSVPKHFVGRNRRGMDMNVAQFENETDKKVERTNWGLPVPNKEAAYISLAKYAKDVPALSPRQALAMNGATDWLRRHFGVHMQNSRVKSQEEVVAGLDMSTSPGFPWTRKYASKRAMYDDWKDFTQYMEDDWDRLKCNDYVAIFGNSLKEEIRMAEKIDVNSLRTFTAGPIEMTVHGNRLFEDMNEKFYASHLKTASVVGFSPWKGGWDELYRKLKKFNNGFALDESQYDSSLRAYLMWAVAEFRWSMLREEDRTPENLARLQVYYRNLINTVIITSDGVFVQKQGGNPSGSVNTIVDNTLILFMLLAYGWMMVCPSAMRSYEMFESSLALALCGDDNTWTVSDEALCFFNARSLIEEWAKIGVITTTDSLDPRPVEELDFLSAFTVFVDGIAVPLYNREKLLTSLLYSRLPGDPSYTLIRAAALLRVGWADVQIRGYLREFISWLVASYGDVLRDSKEWRDALSTVPIEEDLRKFYLGLEGVQYPLVAQGVCNAQADGCIPAIKTEVYDKTRMSLAQRTRRNRVPKSRRQPRTRQRLIGPRMPKGNFLSGQNIMSARNPNAPRRRRAGRRRGRGARGSGAVRGAGNLMLTGKPFGMGAQNRSVGQRRIKRVQNDEFIAAISSGSAGGGATFANTAFPINPGNSTTFPWLAGEAAQWEKYRFEYLEFYFEHDVSAFATVGQTGKVIMSLDYDAADAPPTTKQQMLDTEPHADGMPNEDFGLTANPPDLSGNTDLHYVRLAGLPGGADIRLYDVGNFNIATQGISGASTELGELHVRYSVVFEVPILSSDAKAAPANNQVSWFQSTSAQTNTTAVATTQLVATATANGLSIVNTAGSMVPPAGNYVVDFSVVGADSAAEAYLVLADFQKNGVSVYQSTGNRPFFTTGSSLGAGETDTVSGSVFVSANGTDAFVLKVTQTGAAGTLTAGSSVRWIAV